MSGNLEAPLRHLLCISPRTLASLLMREGWATVPSDNGPPPPRPLLRAAVLNAAATAHAAENAVYRPALICCLQSLRRILCAPIHSKRSTDHLMPSNSVSWYQHPQSGRTPLAVLWPYCSQMVLGGESRETQIPHLTWLGAAWCAFRGCPGCRPGVTHDMIGHRTGSRVPSLGYRQRFAANCGCCQAEERIARAGQLD